MNSTFEATNVLSLENNKSSDKKEQETFYHVSSLYLNKLITTQTRG